MRIFYSELAFASWKSLSIGFYFFCCGASHSLLDAMTNGGLGVAFFAPIDNSRYFLPWRPIHVSSLNMDSFFGENGLRVLRSELYLIVLPSILLILGSIVVRRFWCRG